MDYCIPDCIYSMEGALYCNMDDVEYHTDNNINSTNKMDDNRKTIVSGFLAGLYKIRDI